MSTQAELEATRRWREKNKEQIRAYKRTYYAAHKEELLEKNREWHKKNPDKKRTRWSRWYLANLEEARAKNRARMRARQENDPEKVRAQRREWAKKNPESKLLSSARRRAKEAGLPCTIALSDIVIPEFCPVLPWIRLESGCNRWRPESATLDRQIPELGYVPGNVQVISWRANELKRDASVREIECVAAYVRRIEEAQCL